MAAKKTSKQSTKFSFSWIKLLVAFSFALNLAFIVFVYTLLKTNYFDSSLMSAILGRNYDNNGCYTGTNQSTEYDKICITSYTIDGNGKVLSPEWLKGQTPPKN